MQSFDEHVYRNNLRSLFLHKMHHKIAMLPTYMDQNLNDHQEKPIKHQTCNYEALPKLKNNNGGDADRSFSNSKYATIPLPCHDPGCRFYSDKQPPVACSTKNFTVYTKKADTASNRTRNYGKKVDQKHYCELKPTATEEETSFDGSVESYGKCRTRRSNGTAASRVSAKQLLKMVQRQCKMFDVVDNTLKHMCTPGSVGEVNWLDDKHLTTRKNEQRNDEISKEEERSNDLDIELEADVNESEINLPKIDTHIIQPCKCLQDKLIQTDPVRSYCGDKSVIMSEQLTVPVDDVVNLKVISPMIRKLQRMYINNLKEEMSLLEDFERLPQQVNAVYKTTLFRQS